MKVYNYRHDGVRSSYMQANFIIDVVEPSKSEKKIY